MHQKRCRHSASRRYEKAGIVPNGLLEPRSLCPAADQFGLPREIHPAGQHGVGRQLAQQLLLGGRAQLSGQQSLLRQLAARQLGVIRQLPAQLRNG